MPDASPDPSLLTTQPNLGRRLKGFRSSRGLSLKEVAAATDLSASFISMVETGQTEITVGRLMTLARFYEVSLADLIGPTDRPVVLRRDARSTSEEPGTRVRTEMLSDSGHGDMASGFIHFEAGAEVEEPPRSGRVFALVLSGQIKIEFADDSTVSLRHGDAVWFEAIRRHRLTNTGDEHARIFTLRRPG